jgi:hypothetical protein
MKGWKDIKAVRFEFEFTSYLWRDNFLKFLKYSFNDNTVKTPADDFYV